MPKKPASNSYQNNETKIYGVAACRALFNKRPSDIVKVYILATQLKRFEDLIGWCVGNRRAYKIVKADEMQKITASVHHEGICLIAKEASLPSWSVLLKQFQSAKRQCILYLDGVQNPHNVGNILRSAAHFGLSCILLSPDSARDLAPSARRVSEGGSESVVLLPCEQPTQAFRQLKEAGYSIITTSSHAADSIYSYKLPGKVVFVLGSESTGVAPTIEKLTDVSLAIPGSGAVESLNVSSATAILLSEFIRAQSNPKS